MDSSHWRQQLSTSIRLESPFKPTLLTVWRWEFANATISCKIDTVTQNPLLHRQHWHNTQDCKFLQVPHPPLNVDTQCFGHHPGSKTTLKGRKGFGRKQLGAEGQILHLHSVSSIFAGNCSNCIHSKMDLVPQDLGAPVKECFAEQLFISS